MRIFRNLVLTGAALAVFIFGAPACGAGDDAAQYRQQALELLDQGRPLEAVAELDKAIKIEPNAAELYSLRGAARNDLGDFQRAIEDLDTATELDPVLAVATTIAGSRTGGSGILSGR